MDETTPARRRPIRYVTGQEESTGLLLSAASWIENHHAACAPGYRSMLHEVGISAGATVLDAGCGTGTMFADMADIIGPTGTIVGLDISSRFLQVCRERARELPCAVELVQGSMLDLTWPDDSFDAVWCANIIEYFDDDQLAHVLRLFYRVTRPGGLVAVKDWDGSLFRFAPGPPTLFWHLFERAVQKDIPFARNVHGFFRLVRLDRLFEDIGFVAVRQSSTLLDHRAPLTEAQRVWCVQALEMFREVAATLDLPASDLTFWESLRDPAAPAHPIHHPMFLFGEANTMAVGTVPGGSDED